MNTEQKRIAPNRIAPEVFVKAWRDAGMRPSREWFDSASDDTDYVAGFWRGSSAWDSNSGLSDGFRACVKPWSVGVRDGMAAWSAVVAAGLVEQGA